MVFWRSNFGPANVCTFPFHVQLTYTRLTMAAQRAGLLETVLCRLCLPDNEAIATAEKELEEVCPYLLLPLVCTSLFTMRDGEVTRPLRVAGCGLRVPGRQHGGGSAPAAGRNQRAFTR